MRDVIQDLIAERPSCHLGGARSWAVEHGLLDWLVHNVPVGAHTLETGSGYSTIAFLTRSAQHTVVTPFEEEVRLIGAWCAEHSLDVGPLDHQAGASVDVLPRLSGGSELDVVLIDGDHAFPVPAIDWLYTADRVKVGGVVLVDDINLRPCRVLRDFLQLEPGWEELPQVGRTALFRRTTEEAVTGQGWLRQPWSGVGPWLVGDEDLAGKLAFAKAHLRLRTRLRKFTSR